MGVVSQVTDLVIEGYPRSANTFIVVALRLAASRPLNLAHHVHGPAQLEAAANLGVPALVPVRHPVQAVASLCARSPFIPLSLALTNYIRFHQRLHRVRDHLLIVRFEEATQALGQIMGRLNVRFGTALPTPRLDNGFVERAFRVIDRMNLSRRKGDEVDERTVARPSAARRDLLERAKRAMHDERLQPLAAEAVREYKRFLSGT